MPPDLADDHRHRICGKLHRLCNIKIINGLDQPDAPYLKQVIQILAAVQKPLDHTEHQSQIAAEQRFPGGGIASSSIFSFSLSTGSFAVLLPQISTLLPYIPTPPFDRVTKV